MKDNLFFFIEIEIYISTVLDLIKPDYDLILDYIVLGGIK